jgi:ubiquinone/menaquinone biosynthesis C-methylase UbiE/DNA-binding transcriptional MerR regulator
MDKDNLYTSGQFMALTHVTKKTLRYYDEHNILKPTYVTDYGARYYSEHDLAKMQQILLLKFLGFSLADIRELTINISDNKFIENSMMLQKKLVDDRIEQLQIVSETIQNTTSALRQNQTVDWSQMLEVIHSMGLEHSLKTQYQNASNIAARINLHTLYSTNKQGWFPWVYEQCHVASGMRILELGCGDGSFWTENIKQLPEDILITVSDISEGMLRDARRNIGSEDSRFTYTMLDCHDIPYKDESMDLIIANHVLFYCDDIPSVCREVQRVLKPGGIFLCSTYSANHMKEVSQIAASFDDRIVLSAEKLYENFGKENGTDILQPFFSKVEWRTYEDSLFLSDAEPLISYILSCHGNQTQFIIDRFNDFRNHVKKCIGKGITITKDAGIFICIM